MTYNQYRTPIHDDSIILKSSISGGKIYAFHKKLRFSLGCKKSCHKNRFQPLHKITSEKEEICRSNFFPDSFLKDHGSS
jgi:hypothetical protein